MQLSTIALFGEAEKGEYSKGYFCEAVSQLVDVLGNPPPHTHGLYYAVQALLYHYNLLFFRVKEEGYSYSDYVEGLHLLETQQIIPHVQALCFPGVGDAKIIHASVPYCLEHHTIIITTEADLYDYLTAISR